MSRRGHNKKILAQSKPKAPVKENEKKEKKEDRHLPPARLRPGQKHCVPSRGDRDQDERDKGERDLRGVCFHRLEKQERQS